jgi:hypothetical protein
MISTGDTAFVLNQHTPRIASALGLRPAAPSLGTPVPAHHSTLVAVHPTLACATACAHGPKG